MVKLYIDTTDNKKVIVTLIKDKIVDTFEKILDTKKAQIVLPIIHDLLKKHKLTPQDLTEIEVNPGPGSFTGIRVGISIANALAFSLGIPVNGKRIMKGKTSIITKY